MVLVETKKSGSKGGSWNKYSYEDEKSAISKIKLALREGYRVRVMGKEIFAVDGNKIVYLPQKITEYYYVNGKMVRSNKGGNNK